MPVVVSNFLAGTLTVTIDAADNIAITASGGNVLVNGANPDSGVLAASTVDFIDVTASGAFANNMDASGVTSATGFSSASLALRLIAGEGNDTVTGSEFRDTIEGGLGDDVLAGGAGSDQYEFFLSSPAGNDVIDESGGGTDFVCIFTETGGAMLDLSNPNAQSVHANLTLTLGSATTIENACANFGGNLLTGNTLDNMMNAGGTVVGGAGNDTLNGGPESDDSLVGGAGNDVYEIFDFGITLGTDTINETGGGTDEIRLLQFATGVTFDAGTTGSNQSVHANLSLNVVAGSTLEVLSGGDGPDALTAAASVSTRLRGDFFGAATDNDTLNGSTGNDTLEIGNGADQLRGGAGNDTYVVVFGNTFGTDLIDESSGGGSDTFDLSGFDNFDNTGVIVDLDGTSAQSYGNSSQFTLNGVIENLVGSPFADTISANPLSGAANSRQIDGHNPATASGDTLNVDLHNDPGGHTLTGIRMGRFNRLGDFGAVGYLDIETPNLLNVTALNLGVAPEVNLGAIRFVAADTKTEVRTEENVLLGSFTTSGVNSITYTGNDSFNDRAVVDLSAGNFLPAGGTSVAGGAGGNDTLEILGGSFTTATYNYTNGSDGDIQLDPDGAGGTAASVISYTGLEPITNTGTASDIILNLPAAASNAVLEDDGTSGNTRSRLRSANGTFERTDFVNPTGSLTINRGNSADTLTINALPDFNASLTIGSASNPIGSITVLGAVTLAADKNLTAHASGQLRLDDSNSDVTTTGAGAISLTTERNIVLNAGASIVTANGVLTLSANQQATPTTGSFGGVFIDNALVEATGTGAVNVSGRGGTTAAGIVQNGVYVVNGGRIIGGTSDPVRVIGTGGSSTSIHNAGVDVGRSGSIISSKGAAVDVIGQGVGSGSATDNYGVHVFGGAVITSGGTGSVTVQGTGGSTNSSNNYGVDVRDAGSLITSTNGPVTVTGTGGSGVDSSIGVGVSLFNGGNITAGGATNSVTIIGTGGAGSGNTNDGIRVNSGGAVITSSGGNVQITGTPGASGTDSFGIRIANSGGSISTATNGGNVTLIADSLSLAGSVGTQAGSSATLRPKTNATAIQLGGADAAGTLGLTDAELDLIDTGTLNIGHASSGDIDVTAAIDLTDTPAIAATNLTTSGAVLGSGVNVLTVNTLNLAAPGGIGVNGDPFQINASALTTSTSNAAQFLAESNSVTVGTNDLDASGQTITLGSGTFLTASSASILSNVVVGNGATLGGSGVVSGTVQAQAGGTIAPGNSPGILNTGSLTLTAGSTLAFEINGTTPGTDHDQIVVTGSVSLVDATLSLSGTIGATPPNTQIVLIDNDGSDSVSGTFVGLPQGTAVTVNGQNFEIRYNGGSGNDVVLFNTGTPPNTVFVNQSLAGTTAGASIIDADANLPGNQAGTFGVNVFAVIQDGIDSVADGGTVNVFDGIYAESVSIDKPLTLNGTGTRGDVVIDAPNDALCNGITLTAGADDVTIQHLRVADATANGINATGILNLTLTNLEVTGHGADGFHAESLSDTFQVTDVVFAMNGGDGIDISNSASANLVFENVAATQNISGVRVNNIAAFTDTDGNYSNNADGGHALIDVAGSVTQIRTRLEDNDADNDGTGDGLIAGDGPDGDSHAIGGDLTVRGVTIRDSDGAATAKSQQHGLFVTSVAGAVLFEDSSGGIQPNEVTGHAIDGVVILGAASATFRDGTYSGNRGGGVSGQGAGLRLGSITGAVTFDRVSFANNAARGFAIVNAGSAAISDVTLRNNPTQGGALVNTPTLTITPTTGDVTDIVTVNDSRLTHVRGPVAQNNIEFVGVTSLTVNTDNGDDLVTVTASANTAFNLTGGDPTTAPGDTLIVDASNQLIGVSPTTINVSGKLPIQWAEFETSRFVNAGTVNLVGQGGNDRFDISTADDCTVSVRAKVAKPDGAGGFQDHSCSEVMYHLSIEQTAAIDGAGGNDTVRFLGGAAGNSVTINSNGLMIGEQSVSLEGVESVEVSPTSGTNSITLDGGLTLTNTLHIGGSDVTINELKLNLASAATNLRLGQHESTLGTNVIEGFTGGGSIQLAGVSNLVFDGDGDDNLTIATPRTPTSVDAAGILIGLRVAGNGEGQDAILIGLLRTGDGSATSTSVLTSGLQELSVESSGNTQVEFHTARLTGATGYRAMLQDTDIGVVVGGGAISNPLVATRDGDALRVSNAGVTNPKPIRFTGGGQYAIRGGGLDDTLTFDVSGGFIGRPIMYDGGGGFDTLATTGNAPVAASEVIYRVGPEITQGSLSYEDAGDAQLMRIDFQNLEPVRESTNSGALTVFTTHGSEEISYEGDPSTHKGELRIDRFEKLIVEKKSSITILSEGGQDTITLSTLTDGFTSGQGVFNIFGGNEGDRLILEPLPPEGTSFQYNVSNTTGTNFRETLTLAGEGEIAFLGLTEVILNGNRGDFFTGIRGPDALAINTTVDRADVLTVDASAAPDSHRFRLNDYTPLEAIRFESFSLDTGPQSDTVIVTATANNDTVELGNGLVLNGATIGLQNVEGIRLNLGDGQDTATVTATNGLNAEVHAGGPADGDLLKYMTSEQAALDLGTHVIAAISGETAAFSGFSDVVLEWATVDSLSVFGTNFDDRLQYLFDNDFGAAGRSGMLNLAGDPTRYHVRRMNAVGISTLVGSDHVALVGTSSGDEFTINVTVGPGLSVYHVNHQLAGSSVVSGIVSVVLTSAAAFEVMGELGDDTLTVNEFGGLQPDTARLHFEGGAGHDRLRFQGNTPIDSSYEVGSGIGEGRLTRREAFDTTHLTFADVETILDLTPGPLTVAATHADNAINLAVGPHNGQVSTLNPQGAATGIVSVDGFATYELANKTSLTLQALTGTDSIGVSNLSQGFSGILVVDGGDPSEGDRLSLTGTTGDDIYSYLPHPDVPDAGSFTGAGGGMIFLGIEQITVNAGLGNDSLIGQSGTGTSTTTYAQTGPFASGSMAYSAAVATNGSVGTDTSLRMFGSDGATLLADAANDNSGPLGAAVIAGALIPVAEPLVQFVVGSGNGEPVSEFELFTQIITPEEFETEAEPNNLIGEVNPIAVNIDNSGRSAQLGQVLPGSGDVDLIAVNIGRVLGGQISVTLDNSGRVVPGEIAVNIDNSGRVIGGVVAVNVDNSGRVASRVLGGDISVTLDNSGRVIGGGEIAVTLDNSGRVAVNVDNSGRIVDGQIEVNVDISGLIAGQVTDGQIAVNIDNSHRIAAIVNNDPNRNSEFTQTNLRLLGADGETVIATGANLAAPDNAVVSGPLAAGTYFIEVTNGTVSGEGDYEIVIFGVFNSQAQPAGPSGGFSVTPLRTGQHGTGSVTSNLRNDLVDLTPQSNKESLLRFNNSTPLQLVDLEAVTVDPREGLDQLRVNGTSHSDVMSFDAAMLAVNGQFFGHLRTEIFAAFGSAGDDAIGVASGLNGAFTADGGDGRDFLSVVATAGGPVGLALPGAIIDARTMTSVAIEAFALNAGSENLVVAGAPDAVSGVSITPASANSVSLEGSGRTYSLITTGTLTVAGAAPTAGSQLPLRRVDVHATFIDDTITVSDTSVNVGSGLKSIALAGVPSVRVFGNEGNDTFDVTPSATTSFFIDGGDPIGFGDTLNVVSATATRHLGPQSDEGAFAVPGARPITFDHIEDSGTSSLATGGTPGPHAINLAAFQDGVADEYVLERIGNRIRLRKSPVQIVQEFDADQVTALSLSGSDDDDRLIVDFAGGNPVPVNGIAFDGGEQTSAAGDSLELRGGSAQMVEHRFGSISSGSVSADIAGQVSTIAYEGLEPVVDSLRAVERIFTFGTNSDVITLSDDTVPDDGRMSIVSHASSEIVNFLVPSGRIGINAGSGNDSVTAATIDSLFAGTILLNGSSGDDQLSAATLPIGAHLVGGTGHDSVAGSSLNDVLLGGSGDDTVTAGEGDDYIWTDVGNDVASGQDGDDTIRAGADRDMADGGGGNDVLSGEDGEDVLLGGDDNDWLHGGPGQDTFAGGDGYDTVLGASGGSDLLVASINGSAVFQDGDRLRQDTETDRIRQIELVSLLGGPGADLLDVSGFSGRATLQGGGGHDVLTGTAQNDVIFGDDGHDTVNGGSGSDSIQGQAGRDSILGGSGDDFLNGNEDEDVLNGESGHDRLFGSAGDDLINGGTENDSLFGDAGNDTLRGDAGNDLLRGSIGTDVFDGGAGSSDRVDEAGDTHFTLIGMQLSSPLFGTETVINIERFDLSGGPSANRIDANQATVMVILNGLGGNDTLGGGSGNDLIFGGDGDDTLNGGTGNDRLEGGEGNDGLSGYVGNDSLFGQNGSDSLFGHDGADSVSGGDQDDTVVGGGGTSISGDQPDTLDGGNGNDTRDNATGDTITAIEAEMAFASFPSWVDQI